MFSHLLQRDAGEVAHHIGQNIRSGVADLVKHLFRDDGRCDLAASAFRFCANKAAVGAAFGNRVTDVGPAWHAVPVGVQPTSGLATAFEDVAGQTAGREQFVVVAAPAELVHQHTQRDGGIHAASGDHDLRAGIERGLDRQCAQIGIRR